MIPPTFMKSYVNQILIERIKMVDRPNVGIDYHGELSPLSNRSRYDGKFNREIYPTAKNAIVATRAKVENNMAMEVIAKLYSDPFAVKAKASCFGESVTWQNIKTRYT